MKRKKGEGETIKAFTPPKFNSEFTPEKLQRPGPNRKLDLVFLCHPFFLGG